MNSYVYDIIQEVVQPNMEMLDYFHVDAFVAYHLQYHELSIDPHDTAPLLGYEGRLPDDIRSIVQEVIDETAGCFDICGGYRIFDRIEFVEDGKHIRLANTDFNTQRIVYHQLKHSEQIAVFVCTAGEGIGQWSKQMMPLDPLKGFIADILGSITVEAAVDATQQKLYDDMKQAGLKITNRYSPGYCGWVTSEQHKLFSLLPKDICGIRLTDSALMLPIKSVSGFIGIGAHVSFNPYTCQLCEAVHCVYRNKKSKIELQYSPLNN